MWLAEGVHTDVAKVLVTGSDATSREGGLLFEVTKTANGVQVQTAFQLGPIPFIEMTGTAAGNIYPVLSSCGTPEADPDGGWNWELIHVNGEPQIKVQGTKRDVGQPAPAFPHYLPPPVYDYGHQQVRLEIDQKLMLEGEGFNANLTLDNVTGSPIEGVSVDIRLFDEFDVDQTRGFTLIPVVPTDLGTIPISGSESGGWLILPDDLNISAPEGQQYKVVAVINYAWNGGSYSIETVPETITVFPAPELAITYELPPPDCEAIEFDIKATVYNRGLGPARNLSFSSAQPLISDNESKLLVDFQIVETFVNGESVGSSLNPPIGSLAPGQEVEVIWRLQSTLPGRFVEFAADYRQTNYQGELAPPLISTIGVQFADHANLSATHCRSYANEAENPPLLVVHGIQTATIPWDHVWDIDSSGHSCSEGVQVFDGGNGTLSPLPFWMTEHYHVWIAHLDSRAYGSKDGTASLQSNANCLARQIEEMYDQLSAQQKEQKITIVAHSMGGLVSRACLDYPECRSKVRALYTMGSPHGGLNWAYIVEDYNEYSLAVEKSLLAAEQWGVLETEGGVAQNRIEFCANQVGLCDMDSKRMISFNWNHPNQPDIDYVFIGGGGLNELTGLNPNMLYYVTQGIGTGLAVTVAEGRHDGVVTRKSGIGWASPLLEFLPFGWTSKSGRFVQYWTDEVHESTFEGLPEFVNDNAMSLTDANYGYYSSRSPWDGGTDEGRSQSYACIAYEEGLEGHEAQPIDCQAVDLPDRASATQSAIAESTENESSSLTRIRTEGRLYDYETETQAVLLDTTGPSILMTAWTTGTLDISLMRPDGATIDADFAANNPDEVLMVAGAGAEDALPAMSYYITNTLPGTWQIVVSADATPDIGTRYVNTVLFETARHLSAEADAGAYRPGETATLTATLTSAGVGISNAIVDASITDSGGITESLGMQEVSPGIYVATYTIPNTAGYTMATVSASGIDGSTPFYRDADVLWSVAPGGAAIGDVVSEQAIDIDGDGLYDELRIGLEIDVLRPISATIAAHLTLQGSLIANTATFLAAESSGTYAVQLVFDGDDIRSVGLAGPFTVSNVRLTDIEYGSAPVDRSGFTLHNSRLQFALFSRCRGAVTY